MKAKLTKKNSNVVKLTRVTHDELTPERRRARFFILSLIGVVVGLLALAFTAAFITAKDGTRSGH